jgi:hypothetical protein
MNITIVDSRDNSITFAGFAMQNHHDTMIETHGVVHQGIYPRNKYEFTGAEFIIKADYVQPTPTIFDTSDRNLLITMCREQARNGFLMPFQVGVLDSKRKAYALINLAVSEACERYISEGKITTTIYKFKEEAVKAWRAGGSIDADVPELLMSWYQNEPFDSLELAAQNIEAQALQMRTVIEITERIRLTARRAINDSTTDFETVIAPFLTQLDNI